MGVYENFIDLITNYMCKDQVEDNDEFISLYTLWNLLNIEAEKIQKLYDNTDLVKFLNYIYSDSHEDLDLYKKATENLDVRIPLFRPLKFESVKTFALEKKVEFLLDPADRKNKKEFRSIIISRDFGDDNYYGDHINDFLIRNCKPILDKKFEIISYYRDTKVNRYSSAEFDSSIFSISISYPYQEKPALHISLKKSIDPNDSQYKNYYNTKYTVKEFITKNADDILKVIPVKVKSLDVYCFKLVSDYLEALKKQKKENAEAVKEKIKSYQNIREHLENKNETN